MTEQIDDLIERGKRGQLSQAELALVAADLRKPVPQIPRYTALDILGEHRDQTYVRRVEQFLEGPSPDLAEKALRVLCYSWHLTTQYQDQILQFVLGMPWDDTDQELRTTGIFVAGYLLEEVSNPKLLRALISIYTDELEDKVLRFRAYESLLQAMRPKLAEALSSIYLKYLGYSQWEQAVQAASASVDLSLLREARERLRREEDASTSDTGHAC